MDQNYRNAIRTYGAGLITHIGLVNGLGTEISGGTYARQAVTWSTATNDKAIPSSDLTFNIPAGATVAGWRGFSASSGGTNYGGAALTSTGAYTADGTYVLKADSTSINHTAV